MGTTSNNANRVVRSQPSLRAVGSACSDPDKGISAGLLDTLNGKASVKVGSFRSSLGASPTSSNLAGLFHLFKALVGSDQSSISGVDRSRVLAVTRTGGRSLPAMCPHGVIDSNQRWLNRQLRLHPDLENSELARAFGSL